MTIYETIKAAISVKQAAEHYGLKVNRNGMACCPFHNDRHPSLKLNEDYFFCFGCGAKGDVIDLVARLFNMSSYEAAQKLASDFGLDPKPPTVAAMVKPKRPYIRQFREDEMLCFRVLTDYLHLLEDWKVRYAYKAAVEIVGGEQYILSAVMHADERNQAMSEALGEDVYHYHLHVVYIPVVEKQILWSKRCKDESLRGTVKETITQVSRSKKWESKPVLDKDGNPMLNAKGKKILKSSYSVLQDDFFHFMRNAGYTDVERGERGSTEEHLTVTQFKVQAEQQRLEAVTGQVAQAKRGLENAKAATEKQKKKLEALQKETKTAKTVALTVQEIETMGKKATFGNNITLTPDECDTLKRYAVNGIIANADNKRLKEKLASAEKTVSIWKQRYEAVSEKYMELKQKAQPFLDALEIASERVRAFINSILIRGKETQEHKHPAQKRGQDMEL